MGNVPFIPKFMYVQYVPRVHTSDPSSFNRKSEAKESGLKHAILNPCDFNFEPPHSNNQSGKLNHKRVLNPPLKQYAPNMFEEPERI